VTPTELTGFLTLGVLFVSAIVIPALSRRRQRGTVQERQTEASWAGITATLQAERNTLQARLDERDKVYAGRLELVEAEFENKIRDMQLIIKDLRELVAEQGKTIRLLRIKGPDAEGG
jgi:hypothetical protein